MKQKDPGFNLPEDDVNELGFFILMLATEIKKRSGYFNITLVFIPTVTMLMIVLAKLTRRLAKKILLYKISNGL